MLTERPCFACVREDFGESGAYGRYLSRLADRLHDLEPYYTQAENLYQVHGNRGEDPTYPDAGPPYPHPAVSHEAANPALPR